jgi:predicted lipid-binding transport protein (Tim44 family)
VSAGRHRRPGSRGGSGLGVGAAVWLLWLPLRALGTRLGRQLATVAVLTTVLVGLITVLYEHADPPIASARQRPAPSAAGAGDEPTRNPASAGRPGPTAPHTTTSRGAPAGSARAPGPGGGGGRDQPAAGPGGVAVAWYAGRLGLPAHKVRALASQHTGPHRARVLVAAQTPQGRLATAWVTLAHTPSGWTVRP